MRFHSSSVARFLSALIVVCIYLCVRVITITSLEERVDISHSDGKNKAKLLPDANFVQPVSSPPLINASHLRVDVGDLSSDTARCQHEIHIAVPCWSDEQRRDLYSLIKSILHTSWSSVIHLHIVTDLKGLDIIKTLLDSWQLRMIRARILTAHPDSQDSLLASMTAILTHPDSFLKHDHIPMELLVIDPSFILTKDVRELVSALEVVATGDKAIFFASSGSQGGAAMLVASARPAVNPFPGRCACTEEMKNLLDKKQLQADLWLSHLILCMPASSDSLNSALRQLAPSEFLTVDIPGVFEHKSTSQKYNEILLLDGEKFRTESHPCAPDYQAEPTTKKGDSCYIFKVHTKMPHRTHLHFMSTARKLNTSDPSHQVTLVTQLHLNRWSGLERILTHWEGPVQVGLYLSDTELPDVIANFKKASFMERPNVHVHLVYKRWKYYPINYVRNIGLRQVTTPYLITLDADFVTSPGMAAAIFYKMEYFRRENYKAALLVAAYETYSEQYKIAATKEQFLQELKAGTVATYHAKAGWKDGQKYVDYNRWKTATTPYKVKNEFGFEPYVAVSTEGVLLYEELLVERQRDKLLYTAELEISGMDLVVAHDLYVVHLPHPPSVSVQHKRTAGFDTCASRTFDSLWIAIKKRFGK